MADLANMESSTVSMDCTNDFSHNLEEEIDEVNDAFVQNDDIDNDNFYDWKNDLVNTLLHDEMDTDKDFFRPKSLEEFIQSKKFSEQITTPMDVTTGLLFIMLLKYCLYNSISTEGTYNLFKLINAMFKKQILPDSKHILDKLLNPNQDVFFHALCKTCSSYLGKLGNIDENMDKCPNCNDKVNLKNPSSKNFFALINPSTQISDLITGHDEHYFQVTEKKKHRKNYIEDVYDGLHYRNFIKDKKYYVTAEMNTDGAQKFKCSKFSIWPIMLILNELPKQVRIDNPVVCGLYFGKKKPNLVAFLDKFVDLVNEVTDRGISCNVKSEMRLLRLFVTSVVCDAVARAPAFGMKQFNSKYPAAKK